MSKLSVKLNRIETNLNSIRTVSGLEGKVLEEIPTGIETKFTELNTTISERDAQITELNTTVETKDAQISSLNTTISEKNTEIAEKGQTIQEQAATITEKEAAVTELNATVTAKDEQIASLNTQLTEANNTITEKDAKIDTYIQMCDEANATITQKEAELTTANNTIAEKEAQIIDLNSEITSKDNQIEELTTTNTILTTEVEALTTANSTLTNELAEANATIETLNARIEELEGTTEPELIQLTVELEDESGEPMFQETAFTCSITPTAANGYDYTNVQSGSYFSDFPEAFEVGKTYTITIDNIDCSADGCPQYELVDAAPKSVEVIDQGAGLCTVTFTVRKVATATYRLTENIIPDNTVIPAGTVVGLKSISNDEPLTIPGIYEAVNNQDALITLNNDQVLIGIGNEFTDCKVIDTCAVLEKCNDFEVYMPDDGFMSGCGDFIYGITTDDKVQDTSESIHGTDSILAGQPKFFRILVDATVNYSDVLSPEGECLLNLYYAEEEV